ncbi:MAG: methyl-accepting chemotaxis protein, partial [Peptococcaceae bacterium]|nr:methyl-accepting chemotaxis protein [Peptococcaceae bacterium]
MLAQGSTEQAATIEELSASIQNIAGQIKDSASYAEEVSGVAQNVGKDLTDSNAHMQQMMDAMNEISNKSEEIRKIIKTIEDIAFQTNILALNA